MSAHEGDVRVGIIGTGVGVRTQIPVWNRTPGARVTAVCSHSLDRAASVAEMHGIPHAVTDAQELAELPDVDLVSVATTPDLHHHGVMAAVGAGKHVLCEKPFAMNADEAREMLAAARERGVRHFVNHEFRTDPALVEMRRRLADGFIGSPSYVVMTDFNSFVPDTQHILSRWWFKDEKGGGWLLAHGSHRVDTLRWLFGEIVGVTARLETVIPTPQLAKGPVDSTVDDSYFLLLRFASGATGVCVDGAAAAVPVHAERFVAYGSDGTLVVDGDKLFGRRKGEPDLQPLQVQSFPSESGEHAMFSVWAAQMVASIRTGTPIRPDFEDGLRCVAVLDAARRSARTGTSIDLDPEGPPPAGQSPSRAR